MKSAICPERRLVGATRRSGVSIYAQADGKALAKPLEAFAKPVELNGVGKR